MRQSMLRVVAMALGVVAPRERSRPRKERHRVRRPRAGDLSKPSKCMRRRDELRRQHPRSPPDVRRRRRLLGRKSVERAPVRPRPGARRRDGDRRRSHAASRLRRTGAGGRHAYGHRNRDRRRIVARRPRRASPEPSRVTGGAPPHARRWARALAAADQGCARRTPPPRSDALGAPMALDRRHPTSRPRRRQRSRHDDDEMREQAVFVLSQRRKTESVPELIDLAKNAKHPAARKAAIFWLGQSGDPRAVDVYAELLGLR